MSDFIWHIATSIANKLQLIGLLPDNYRKILRNFGHLIISAPPERVIKTNDGRWYLTPPSLKGSRSYKAGTYEQSLVRYVQSNIKLNEICIDIGAFIGFYTVIFSKIIGLNGKVFAVEPENNAYSYLLKNIRINNLQNVVPINKAADDKIGFVKFTERANYSNKKKFGGFVSIDEKKQFKLIESITVDSLKLNNVSWVKLDTDGNETKILNGMKETISKSPNIKLIIEIDPSHFSKNHNIINLVNILKEYGFDNAIICEDNYKLINTNNIYNINNHRNLIFFKK